MSRHSATKPVLQNFDPVRFMRNYWQRQPLVVKNALVPDFLDLRPADLFTLAQRTDVESRLITRKIARGHWRYGAQDGPFKKSQLLAAQPRRDWTLLVQRVNEWLPRVDLLFEYFNFIANWRIDDIMISYATPGGTVGPHLDNYDVFLCQLRGERTWRYGAHASPDENLEANQPVRILRNFEADFETVARPGDMLYIPPRFAHYGIAEGESITVSVGFRAPQARRLAGILMEQIALQARDGFYGDKGAPIQKNPGRFGDDALKKLFAMAKTGLASGQRSMNIATASDALLVDLCATPNAQILSRKKIPLSQFKLRWRRHYLQRNPRNRYFYRAGRGSVTLYAAGERFVLPGALKDAVADFCNRRIYPSTPARLRPRSLAFWHEMFSLGFVFFQE